MKRGLLAAALCLFALVVVGQSYAQDDAGASQWSKVAFMNKLSSAKVQKFSGTVLSHDVACHCIVVNTPKGELTLQDDYAKFMQEYDQAKGLKIGSKAVGTYKTVDHIHYATNVAYAKEQ
jgi:hypothetical protein